MPASCSGFLVPIFMMIINTSLAFIEPPSSLIVPAGAAATFRCRHQNADSVGWLVNNTSLGSNSDITPGTLYENNHLVNTLTIIAHPKYNGTEVECVATFFNDSPPELSPAVTLTVQGPSFSDINMSPTSEPDHSFIEVPSPVIVAVDDEAVFRCQHASANTIEWKINGTSLGDFHPPNITQTIFSSGSSTHTLSIQALASYNQTSVQCVAFLDTTIRRSEESSPVLLLMQGPLLSIKNLRIANSSLMWEPPFSLNLTNIHPDITYCVDVYNVSCAGRQHLISDCGLTEPTYHYSHQRADLFEFVIVPRSNVANPRNGTPQTLREEYLFFNASKFMPIITKNDNQVHLSLKYHIDVVRDSLRKTLDSYSIQLESADSAQPTFVEYSSSETQMTESGIIIQFNNSFEQARIWNYIVKAAVCGGIPLSNSGHISTHDIQSIEVHESNGIFVTGESLNGSQVSGIFTIAYSLTEDYDVHYSISKRVRNQQRIATKINQLPGNKYNVSAFSLVNGLPFIRAATKPQSVILSNVKGPGAYESVPVPQRTTAISNCFYVKGNTSTNMTSCIKCTVTNHFDGTCVAIAHLKTSLLVNSSNGLSDISVNFLNRSLDNTICSGCIDGVSIKEYVITIFPYQEDVGIFGSYVLVSQPRPSVNTDEYSIRLWQIFTIVILLVLVTVMVVASVVTLVIAIKRRQKLNSTVRKDNIKVKVCDAYEVTKLARKREHMKQNPAYGIVKVCDCSTIDVKTCSAYEVTKRNNMPMEQNPSYGELGHGQIIYETIS